MTPVRLWHFGEPGQAPRANESLTVLCTSCGRPGAVPAVQCGQTIACAALGLHPAVAGDVLRLDARTHMRALRGDAVTIRRLPIYFLVDCSSGLAGPAVAATKRTLQSICDGLRGDPMALDSTFASVIAYGDNAVQARPLTELLAFQLPSVKRRPPV